MKIRTQNVNKTRAQNPKQRRVRRTIGAAQMERFSEHILAHDDTHGGYTYGDDWSGEDFRALCDIFGA